MDGERLNRLRFRAWRRGFREADLILGPFADTRAAALSDEQFDALERLLDQADQDLYAWIIGTRAPPSEYDGPVLQMIRDFRFDARNARPDMGA